MDLRMENYVWIIYWNDSCCGESLKMKFLDCGTMTIHRMRQTFHIFSMLREHIFVIEYLK